LKQQKLEISFAVAILVSIFTELRLGPIGLGELFLFAVFIFSLITIVHTRTLYSLPFSKFWLYYIFISSIGFTYNLVIIGSDISNYESIIFDYLAYVFIFISCIGLEIKLIQSTLIAKDILYRFYWAFSVVIIILFSLSLVGSSIGPFQLRVGPYFAPMVKNLHQSAMVIALIPALSLYYFIHEDNYRKKFIFLIISIIFSFITLETGSSKAAMGVFLSLIFFILYYFTKNLSDKSKFFIWFVGISIAIQFSILNIENFGVIFNEADQGGGRSILYSQALDKIIGSIFFGYGAGAHLILDGIWTDTHQTFLTAFLQAGLIGFCILVIFIIRVSKHIYHFDRFLFCVLMPFFCYAIGGDLLRRLPMWLILMLLFYISQQESNPIKHA
jgi:hypothetical protein